MSPGVYLFKNSSGSIIYIGKANRLRQRVRSYFQPPTRLGPKTAQLASQITSVDYILVNSGVEALLLEARLIKKYQPPYNISTKDSTSPYYIHLTRDKFPKPVVNHQSVGAIAGPFLSGLIARRILRALRRIAPYHTETPCFYRHLGLCHPCPDDSLTRRQDYLPNIIRLRRLLRGQFKPVLSQAVKNREFEIAASLRDLMLRPIPPEEYVTNPNLLSDRRQEALSALQLAISYWPLARIECFDVAHLAGQSATAAMTVAIDGEITPRNYRHFTIHTPGPNDVAMLAEALTRRLRRADWPLPNLIVLDGGLSQLSIINWTIPTIGLAKKEELIYFSDGHFIRLDRRHPGLQLLQKLRDEAHRFSGALHHKHRSVIIKSNVQTLPALHRH